MKDLKPLYDAVIAAEAEVGKIESAMMAAFETGTEEGKAEALAMRPALDEAKNQAKEANLAYISMRESDAVESGNARKFVPVPGAEKQAGQVKQLTRAEFEAMSAADRMSFMLNDGNIVD